MVEKMLEEKFANLGYLSKSNELYLPVEVGLKLLEEGYRLGVAVIGVEFFHRKDGKIMPVEPLNGIDCSNLLNKYSDWRDVLNKCYDAVKAVLIMEKKRDDNQWCNLTFLKEQDWNK
ncbi:hypothetical protein P22_3945 [Propionispora sp. 2/2-37]|uniref:hypothetical protein n=1 Tax=Propionispora sp. 2/2-37 TaxID=1677858 RepID=UPI0006BB7ACE|nr:hypothetical protein [Propionispora sp. 2/2-37]CUH97799.1 hypothetical protein P22_3945 [Propionispora sp. 2/2-37]